MKQKSTLFILTIVLVLAAIGGYVWYQRTNVLAESEASHPVIVDVAKVSFANVPQHLETMGTLYANQAVQLSAQIDGQIQKILFTQGRLVKKGTPLIELDATIFKANLKSTQADLELSKLNYERSKKLAKRKALSREDLDTARANFQEKQAAVNIDEAKLAKMTIVAPFNGVLGARQVNLGQYVSVGQPLVELVDTQDLKVTYRVPEKYLSQLKLGQVVKVHVQDQAGEALSGSVDFISPTVDLSTRSVELQGNIPNPDNQLSPGQFVKVIQKLGVDKNAIVVPEQALVPTIDGQMVYRVVKGKAVATPVTIGARFRGLVEIVKGLSANDVVVIAGQQKIKDGSAVKEVFRS